MTCRMPSIIRPGKKVSILMMTIFEHVLKTGRCLLAVKMYYEDTGWTDFILYEYKL